VKASSWIFSYDDGLVSSGENPSFGLPERATTASTSYPSCGRRLGESALIVVREFSYVGSVDVGAVAPDGGCVSRRRPRDSW
jgi:hypothetical protein